MKNKKVYAGAKEKDTLIKDDKVAIWLLKIHKLIEEKPENIRINIEFK
jgi:hypothetical protein